MTAPSPGYQRVAALSLLLALSVSLYRWLAAVAPTAEGNPLLFLTFLVKIALGYLPFVVLGHGQVSGSLLTHASQQGGNAGIVQAIVRRISGYAGLNAGATLHLEYVVDAALLATVSALVWLMRLRGATSMELAIVLLLGSIFVVSSHVFPWYVTALLPWIACSVRPVVPDTRSIARSGTVAMAWYVACTALFGYANNVTQVHRAPWWAAEFYVGRGLVGILAMVGAILLVYTWLFLPPMRRATLRMDAT